MKLVSHGGSCCGMRHIYCVYNPDTVLIALPAIPPRPVEDQSAHNTWVAQCNARGLYLDAAPKETAVERMKRILLFCEDTNKQRGIIEVVVAGRDGVGQAAKWRPYLEKLGFKLVNESLNSTSPNTIYVWHYNTGIGNRKNLVPENTAGEEQVVEVNKPLTGTLMA